jgi:hypothetical protein
MIGELKTLHLGFERDCWLLSVAIQVLGLDARDLEARVCAMSNAQGGERGELVRKTVDGLRYFKERCVVMQEVADTAAARILVMAARLEGL